ncbi:NAD-dependent deacetylase [Desulfacinum hydrothermale DSM 13146]|uniref:protein acetyllysine N-acetyltransferase n=1 Tax=Desulfacinum hydrothermale DSM 13146 TaxID=1121390 RepID=A0A1W1X2A4_9BACT|nr:NAD-dependent deacylase [Desulfacinum hydrothermale]SMC18072.1 NAD-dependent deacetylase [Desulfacinum hydrothermale DSM 13146]
MDRLIQQAADRLLSSAWAVALTGAGISVESGIPDFRSPGGLWSKYDPMEYGDIQSFRRNPGKVWRMLLDMDHLLQSAAPNPAHYALARLEQEKILKGVVTQNVDSLHQRAGSRKVVEFHGHGRSARCDGCGRHFPREHLDLKELPPRCPCGGPIRPNFVFFGEAIPVEAQNEALRWVERCDVLLVVGTSATVAPASHLPIIAKGRGAFIIEINPQESDLTPTLTDLYIGEPAGRALSALVSAMGL